ncbi:MAG: hypothetical protein DU481_10665 [Nitrosomonas sp.]
MDEQKLAVKNFCLDAALNGIFWSITEVLPVTLMLIGITIKVADIKLPLTCCTEDKKFMF